MEVRGGSITGAQGPSDTGTGTVREKDSFRGGKLVLLENAVGTAHVRGFRHTKHMVIHKGA